MVLAAPAAEERAAWVDALQREAPRFVAQLAESGVGCCPWYHVPFDDAGEPSLAVCEASSQLLRLLGAVGALGNAPLNFVTIFGQARQGKSTLLNQLAKSLGLFAISHKDQTCTRGVDLSAKFVPVESFMVGSGGGGGGEKLHVGFVDVEGQGVEGVEYDTKLVTPALLFSKVLLFNWKGAPQPDMILDMLGVLAEAAESVNLAGGEGGEEGGEEEEEEKDEEEGEQKDIFGHLHIIFRDWTFESDATARALLAPEKPRSKAKKLSKEAKKRNAIRATLQRVFTSITMWTFPAPVDNIMTERVCAETLTAGFKERTAELRAAVGAQLAEGPTKLGGETLTCADLADLMPAVAEAMNADDMLTPQGLFAQVADRKAARACAKYRDDLRKVQDELEERTEAEEEEKLRAEFDEREEVLRAVVLALVPEQAGVLDGVRDDVWRRVAGANQDRLREQEKRAFEQEKETFAQREKELIQQQEEFAQREKELIRQHGTQIAELKEKLRLNEQQRDDMLRRSGSFVGDPAEKEKLEREKRDLEEKLEEANAKAEAAEADAAREKEAATAAGKHAAEEKKAREAAEADAAQSRAAVVRMQHENTDAKAALERAVETSAETEKAADDAQNALRQLQQRTDAERGNAKAEKEEADAKLAADQAKEKALAALDLEEAASTLAEEKQQQLLLQKQLDEARADTLREKQAAEEAEQKAAAAMGLLETAHAEREAAIKAAAAAARERETARAAAAARTTEREAERKSAAGAQERQAKQLAAAQRALDAKLAEQAVQAGGAAQKDKEIAELRKLVADAKEEKQRKKDEEETAAVQEQEARRAEEAAAAQRAKEEEVAAAAAAAEKEKVADAKKAVATAKAEAAAKAVPQRATAEAEAEERRTATTKAAAKAKAEAEAKAKAEAESAQRLENEAGAQLQPAKQGDRIGSTRPSVLALGPGGAKTKEKQDKLGPLLKAGHTMPRMDGHVLRPLPTMVGEEEKRDTGRKLSPAGAGGAGAKRHSLTAALERRARINDGEAVSLSPRRGPFDPYAEFGDFSHEQCDEMIGMFEKYDEDKNGKISLEELKRMMEALDEPQNPMQLKKMLEAVDEDGDSQINKREFFMLFRKVQSGTLQSSGLKKVVEKVVSVDVRKLGVKDAAKHFVQLAAAATHNPHELAIKVKKEAEEAEKEATRKRKEAFAERRKKFGQ
jgi:hypothetical protein